MTGASRLPENWSEHVSPTGHYYYYNSVTKESTYEKPKLINLSKSKNNNQKKQPELPIFKYELPGTDWILVFTNQGSHFFHNRITKESHWQVDDPKLKEIINRQDKKNLLLLIAKSRGLKLDDDVEQDLENTRLLRKPIIEQEDGGKVSNHSEATVEAEPHENVAKELGNVGVSLVGGYSSSDEESSDEEAAEEARSMVIEENIENEEQRNETNEDMEHTEISNPELPELENSSSEEENGIDLSELDDISSSDEETTTSEQSRLKFIELLSSSSLNVYGTWEMESLKIMNDPRFYEIETNKERKELFDEWTKVEIERSEKTQEIDIIDEDNVNDPPIIKFYKFISDPSVVKKRFYFEFKQEYKDKLANFMDLKDKERERIYKEFVSLSSQPESVRINMFKDFLLTSKIFKKNLTRSDESSRNYITTLKLDDLPSDVDHIYRILRSIEVKLDIVESIRFNAKYWVVEPGLKVQLLHEVCTTLLGVANK